MASVSHTALQSSASLLYSVPPSETVRTGLGPQPDFTQSNVQSLDHGVLSMNRLGRRRLLTAMTCAPLPWLLGAAAIPLPRIACLDWALAETMLALGTHPIAVVGASDWARFVVEPVLPPEIADLGLSQEINFELLASLRPDLILISPFLESLEPQLRRIARTMRLSVYDDSGKPLAQREAVTLVLGERIGRRAAADEFLDQARSAFDAVQLRLAPLRPRPMLITTFVDSRHVRVYGGASLYQNVLARIGLSNAWAGAMGYFGYATVGIEELATAGDVQLIAFEPLPNDLRSKLQQSPLWTRLPFIRSGHVAILDPVSTFGGLPAALRFARLLAQAIESQAG